MRIFVDTSAFYALLDRNDANHKKSKDVWNKVLNPENVLIVTNYIFVGMFRPYTTSSRHESRNRITGRHLTDYQY